MKKATIIFGSTTGNTEIVADKIAETMTGYDVQVIYVTDAKDDTAVKGRPGPVRLLDDGSGRTAGRLHPLL